VQPALRLRHPWRLGGGQDELLHQLQLYLTGECPQQSREVVDQIQGAGLIVDDLDRCEAEAAYKLIEGIKIYLNLPNCVFVLGMNQRVIQDAIASHLPKVDDPSLQALRAREYLDKLCQSIHHLPLPREPVRLLRSLVADAAVAEPVCKVLESYACLPANPRKIKSFAGLLQGYLPRFEGDLADKNPQLSEDCAKRVAKAIRSSTRRSAAGPSWTRQCSNTRLSRLSTARNGP
jgi:hypothetical protein